MNQNSESLLTQILLLVQDIHVAISDHERRITRSEEGIAALDQKLDKIVAKAFVGGDFKAHGEWHTVRQQPAWKRWLLAKLN